MRLSEPLHCFVMAIVVLIIALSVITPMYSIISKVQKIMPKNKIAKNKVNGWRGMSILEILVAED